MQEKVLIALKEELNTNANRFHNCKNLFDQELLTNFVDNLCDLNIKSIFPFTKVELYILRRHFGILFVGNIEDYSNIGKCMHINMSEYKDYIINKVYYLVTNQVEEYFSNKPLIPLTTSLEDLDFSIKAHKILKSVGNKTLNDLLEYNLLKLFSSRSKNMGGRSFVEILTKVHGLGYHFTYEDDFTYTVINDKSLVDDLPIKYKTKLHLSNSGIKCVSDLISNKNEIFKFFSDATKLELEQFIADFERFNKTLVENYTSGGLTSADIFDLEKKAYERMQLEYANKKRQRELYLSKISFLDRQIAEYEQRLGITDNGRK